MSGVEIVGLVLGAIPICKFALKELNQASDRVERFRRWRDEIPKHIDRLNSQRIQLRLSLQRLFCLVGLPPPDLADIEQDTNEWLWKNKSIADDLHQRYGDTYRSVENDCRVIR